MAWRITVQAVRPKRTGQLYATVDSERCWEHTSSQGSAGVSRLGTKGKVLASNGQIVCLFLWVPLNPTRGISNSSPAIVLRIFADHPAASKVFKGRKEKSSCCWPTGYIYSRGVNMLLWNGLCQQQDVWQSQRHISGTETLGHSFASYLFIKAERGAVGQGAAGGGPTCVWVDKPQGSGQQSPNHKGCKRDAHHCRSVQHEQRVWETRQHTVQTCWHDDLEIFKTSQSQSLWRSKVLNIKSINLKTEHKKKTLLNI